MDHDYAEEHGLVALYRSARLDPEEERRFEEHFFACDACQEELDHQRRFERGLLAMQAEDASAPAVAKAKPEGKILRFPRRPALWLALAASLLFAAALPFALLRQSRAILEQEAATWRGRAQQGEVEKKALAARLAESERLAKESDEKARRLEGRLAEAEAPPSGRAPIGQPMSGTPLLLLTRLRGAEPSPAANRLDLRKTTGIVQLALDAGGEAGFAGYRAILTDAAGRKLFAAGDLHPNALEVILLTFPGDFFAAGEYRLRLEGRRADGKVEEIERFRFQVVR